jgi:hypothetical protein
MRFVEETREMIEKDDLPPKNGVFGMRKVSPCMDRESLVAV